MVAILELLALSHTIRARRFDESRDSKSRRDFSPVQITEPDIFVVQIESDAWGTVWTITAWYVACPSSSSLLLSSLE